MVNIQDLIDDAKCYETVRAMRWPDGVTCPHCSSASVIKNGRDDTQPHRQRYGCHACGRRFDDLIGADFRGSQGLSQNRRTMGVVRGQFPSGRVQSWA
jgi:transposase-like protein